MLRVITRNFCTWVYYPIPLDKNNPYYEEVTKIQDLRKKHPPLMTLNKAKTEAADAAAAEGTSDVIVSSQEQNNNLSSATIARHLTHGEKEVPQEHKELVRDFKPTACTSL